MFRQLLILIIRFYQAFSAVFKVLLGEPCECCRFTPTCSHYTLQAIERYGCGEGLRLGLRRLMRCHRWATGGYDPVPFELVKIDSCQAR